MYEKLKKLDKNIHELESFKKSNTEEEISKNLQKQWVLRYGLFECIQIVIDTACHIVSTYNLGSPDTYVACIEHLEKFDYLKNELAEKLKSIIGLRNLLIHEYAEIDIHQLYSFLDHLDDFRSYAKNIKDYL